MHAIQLDTDTYNELYNGKRDIYNIVNIVKANEQQINDYYKQGMTIEKAIDKAIHITSGQSPHTQDHIQIHLSDFSEFEDSDLYGDSGMVYKSKQFSDICNTITSGCN